MTANETTPSDAAIAQSFRKRPVVIQAALFDGTKSCADAIAAWAIDSENFSTVVGRSGKGERCFDLRIRTLEGSMTALPGDWIIRGVQGEFYPCKPEIFAKTYEPATAHETTPSDAAIAQAFREALARTSLPGAPGPFVRSVLGRAREIEQGRELPDELKLRVAAMTALRAVEAEYPDTGKPIRDYLTFIVDERMRLWEACRRMGNAKRELSACGCGNDFIEIFGDDISGWWVGCKPCSRAGLHNHSKHAIRAQAVSHWNSCMGNRDE